MAQGTFQIFEEAVKYIGNGTVDLDRAGWKIALYPNTGAPTFAAADALPAYAATYNGAAECSGGGYTAGGAAASVTWTEVGGVATFAISANVVWTQNGTGPTNIFWGLLYDTNATGTTNAAIGYIDMGNQANISLQDGDITISAGNVFTASL